MAWHQGNLRRRGEKHLELCARSCQGCPPELIIEHNKSEHRILLKTIGEHPSTIIFRGLGDESDFEKAKGLETGFLWIDEPSEIQEAAYKMLRAQLCWVLPDGRRPPYMALLTSNPEPGWVKRRFIDHMIDGGVFIPSLPRDNPHLPPRYEDELRSSFDENWVKGYLDGSWEVSEGMVFEELSQVVHCIEYADHEGMTIVSGLDHGTTGVTAALVVAFDEGGNVYALEEYYRRNRLISEHATSILSLLGRYSDDCCTVIDPSAQAKTLQGKDELYSVQDEYRRNGLYTMPGAHASIDVGINLIKEYLRVNPNRIHPFRQQRGAPRLFIIKSRCLNLWREMTELRKEFQLSGQPKFVGDDHVTDCLRYVVMSRPQPPQTKKPDPYEHLKLADPASYDEWHSVRKIYHPESDSGLGDFG